MKHEWEYKKLGDICDKGSSNISLNKIEDNIGEYALFGASGYVKGIDFYHNENPYIGIVKDGSGCGRVNIYPAKSSLVGTMQYIYPKQNCDIKFLMYLLQSLDLSSLVTGAAIPHIYFKDYSKFSIPVPPLPTQQSIVSELDSLSKIIADCKETLKDYDALEQSIFYDMFGDPVKNEKGWEVKKLGEVTKSTGGGTPSKDVKEYWDGDIVWVSSKDMKTTYISESQLHITKKGVENSSAKMLPIGTILIVNRSGILKHTLPIAITTKELTVNQDIKALIVNDSNIDNIYLLYCLKMFSPYLLSMIKAVTVDSIDFNIIKNLNVPLPPLPLQQQFASKIEAIEKMKSETKQALQETETLFQARMDYWFNG